MASSVDETGEICDLDAFEASLETECSGESRYRKRLNESKLVT